MRATFKLVGLALVALIATFAIPASAGAVTQTAYTNDVNAAIFLLSGQTTLTSTQPTCLQNEGQAVRAYATGLSNNTITTDLLGFDQQLIQDGAPCDSGWDQSTDPATVASTYSVNGGNAPLAASTPCCVITGYAQATQYAYDPSTGTGGPYNLWWNINGHTSSAWLMSQWFGYGAHSFQGPNTSPQCVPGSTAPTFSVSINFCQAANNGGLYYSINRINFTVTQTISIFGVGWSQSSTHQYYVNLWINGYYQEGCSIGC